MSIMNSIRYDKRRILILIITSITTLCLVLHSVNRIVSKRYKGRFTDSLEFQVQCETCPEAEPIPVVVRDEPTELEEIECSLDGNRTKKCLEDDEDVFVPVSEINKYFEVYGDEKGNKKKGNLVYEFSHSYGKVNAPTPVYEPGGAFLNFKFYHVEVRGMLQCVTASEGVPLAVQWNPAGYFYSIAVSQFGLAHHAKGIIEGNPEPTILTDSNTGWDGWTIPKKVTSSAKIFTTLDEVKGQQRKVLAFSAPESMTDEGPTLSIDSSETELTLCVSIKMTGPGGLTIKVKTVDDKDGYFHFTHEDVYMKVDGSHVTLGMKQKNFGKWMRLTRDLMIDYQKATGKPKQVAQVVSVTLHGKGYIDNMTISSSAHNENLMHAANWLLDNQDKKGGWPTSTAMHTHEIKLPANWYSAMGQGQAMSTLVRAYNLTGDRKYLECAERALYLYTLDSIDGGVRARFLGKYDWYEEYPTTPTSTFVFNGFIFSMMGLYDVMKTSEGGPRELAQRLWDSGMYSLKLMLGLYDSGVGTLYDLRHVINHEPPNRARWDYHRTHIALIHEMAIVDGDPIFWSAWERWKGYMKGHSTETNGNTSDLTIELFPETTFFLDDQSIDSAKKIAS